MKNLKLMMVAAVALLFLGISNVSAQETVIIKTYEFAAISMGAKSKMIVTEPSGTSTTIELKNMTFKPVETAAASNNAILQTEINKWKSIGYKIDEMSNASFGDNLFVTTIILSK